jgi:predicted RNA-binding Zn-ribbon protein involved in translation (DUF1610 family)
MFFGKKKPGKPKRKKTYPVLGTMPTQLECPKCGSKLNQLIAGAAGQIYVCPKCGYRGAVGLEPGWVRLGKKRKI